MCCARIVNSFCFSLILNGKLVSAPSFFHRLLSMHTCIRTLQLRAIIILSLSCLRYMDQSEDEEAGNGSYITHLTPALITNSLCYLLHCRDTPQTPDQNRDLLLQIKNMVFLWLPLKCILEILQRNTSQFHQFARNRI